MREKDIYIKNYLYPDPKHLFDCSLQSLEDIKDNCLFVIDTNALLLPYTVSNKTLTEIEKVFNKLIEEEKFYIPGQVAREFVNNRPNKVKKIYQDLKNKQNKVNNIFGIKTNYPLLTPLEGQDEIIQLEKEISKLIKEYNKNLSLVINQVKNWTWNDPISKIYKKLFIEDIIIDIETTEEITKDFEKRHLHKISPGYKDGNKEDQGIGDYLIWKTIIKLGKEKKKNIVFISGEEKPDWWYRSEKEKLYPRFELIHEFERECNNSFHIIKLSKLLEMYGVNNDIVKEIETEEKPKERLMTDESNTVGPNNSH